MGEDGRRRRPFWYLRRRPARVAAEIDEELRHHLLMRADDLRAGGMTPEAARREALRRFGDLQHTRRYCRRQDLGKERRMQRGLMWSDLGQDLGTSLRGLRRSSLTSLAIVATVGLGIGATTAIFAAIDAALIRPLPYAEADRLVRLYLDSPPHRFRFSVADFLALQEEQTRFAQVAGYTERAMAFSDGRVAERLRGREVSWTYFAVLGIRPDMGRGFTESDGRPGATPAVMASHGFWRRRLGGRPDAIGGRVRLDGVDHTLIGVLPPLVGPLEEGQELFVAAQWPLPERRGPFFITPIGRLEPTASRTAALEELKAISRRLFPVWRATYQDEKASWGLMGLREHVVGDVRTMAGLALAAVGLVWLIACANASNLLVARVTARRRELAVRAALGASRARVLRHLFAESLLLASGAAAAGVALAWAGIQLLRSAGAAHVPRAQEIALDGRVLGLLACLTAASAILFGLVPALHGTRGRLDEWLRAGDRSYTSGVASRRLRRALVAAQFAIATPLLVVAGLLLVSLRELARVELGFATANLVTGAVLLPEAQYGEAGRVTAFWEALEEALLGVPGIAGVAFADGRPPDDVGNWNNFDLEERPTAPDRSPPVVPWVAVTPEYFGVLGLTLLEGRLLDERDGGDDPPVVVVDRAWARRFFPGTSALGKRLREGGCTTCPWTTVVGVVSDVRYAGLDRPHEGAVYWPIAGRPVSFPIETGSARFRYVVLRTQAEVEAVLPAVRQALRRLDPGLPLAGVASAGELVARSVERPRSLTLLVGCLAAVALALSTLGVYGVMAYYVELHAKDLGIRLALGGVRADVVRLVVGQGLKVAAAGVAVGLLAALGLARLASSVLFRVGAADGPTFVTVAAFLLVAAFGACLLPARRASGVEPARVLRVE